MRMPCVILLALAGPAAAVGTAGKLAIGRCAYNDDCLSDWCANTANQLAETSSVTILVPRNASTVPWGTVCMHN